MINLGKLPGGKFMEALFTIDHYPNRTTPVYDVLEIGTHNRLGMIKWYGPWRGFCFFPNGNTVFDGGCMQQIISWMAELNTRYRQLKKEAANEKL